MMKTIVSTILVLAAFTGEVWTLECFSCSSTSDSSECQTCTAPSGGRCVLQQNPLDPSDSVRLGGGPNGGLICTNCGPAKLSCAASCPDDEAYRYKNCCESDYCNIFGSTATPAPAPTPAPGGNDKSGAGCQGSYKIFIILLTAGNYLIQRHLH